MVEVSCCRDREVIYLRGWKQMRRRRGRWQGKGEGEGGVDLFEECDTLFQHFNMSLTPQF